MSTPTRQTPASASGGAMSEYRYRLRNTGHGSAKYGPCEVCGKHVSEVFYQVEERRYSGGWTHHGTRSLFGHESCLTQQRRNEAYSSYDGQLRSLE